MSAMTLQTTPLWSVSREEDRRFRWILLQTLAVCFAVGAITPYIRIPQPDVDRAKELPPRHVQLLVAQPRPANPPAPLPAPPVVTAPPKPRTEPEQPQAAPIETPRQKAARSGVLALGDALGELQTSTPKTGTTAARESPSLAVANDLPRRSTLSANVSKGSGGIKGGIAHQSVLGETGLPDREDTRMESRGPALGEPAERQLSSGPPGAARSHDEIQEILDRNKGAMYTLYNRELREDAGLQGKLVMSITISPAGNVTRCLILSSELSSASLERQLVALVSSIDFGNQPGAAEVTTRIPVEFFPR
jgi:protein TonB